MSVVRKLLLQEHTPSQFHSVYSVFHELTITDDHTFVRSDFVALKSNFCQQDSAAMR